MRRVLPGLGAMRGGFGAGAEQLMIFWPTYSSLRLGIITLLRIVRNDLGAAC